MFEVIISPLTNEIINMTSGELPAGMAVISIRNFQDGLPVARPKERHLVLCFDDKVEAMPQSMSPTQAEALRDFIISNQSSIDTLLVHCHAGTSRSPAVAAAILRAYGAGDMHIWSSSEYRLNTLCYRRVLKAFGVRPAFVQYRSRINRNAFRKARASRRPL
jgi:protein-tyrosine phosphatase